MQCRPARNSAPENMKGHAMRRLARAIGFVACLAAAFCAPPFEARQRFLSRPRICACGRRPIRESLTSFRPAPKSSSCARIAAGFSCRRAICAAMWRAPLWPHREMARPRFRGRKSQLRSGYPYSGSSPYFSGLTELRHSEPLGALFGYHVYRPC